MDYNPKQPLNWAKIYATLFKYDINSLVHGVFLSLLEGGRVRSPRAVTGFFEAKNVVRVVSGVLKNSPRGIPLGETSKGPGRQGGWRVEFIATFLMPVSSMWPIKNQRVLQPSISSLIRGFRLGEDATKFAYCPLAT